MEDFKKAVLLSANIREASWVESMEPFKSKYSLDLLQSTQKAIKELNLSIEMIIPVYLLLTTAWNDTLDWANNDSVDWENQNETT